ncbi:hypothetical protein VNO80_15820 [Phaseolus coccineus]|uniref:Uncharacterized protein n=1 Tax=Phaseolus coccineus TaxID=3886 RepID=A0AAN9MMB6_PHACN
MLLPPFGISSKAYPFHLLTLASVVAFCCWSDIDWHAIPSLFIFTNLSRPPFTRVSSSTKTPHSVWRSDRESCTPLGLGGNPVRYVSLKNRSLSSVFHMEVVRAIWACERLQDQAPLAVEDIGWKYTAGSESCIILHQVFFLL